MTAVPPSRRVSTGHRARSAAGLVLVVALAAVVAACGGGRAAGDGRSEARILAVPEAYATIQGAVDAARPGDMVLVSPGTYVEAVVVKTAELVIRGTDRNAVVLDGEDRLINGLTVHADRVAIENLTVRRYSFNGVHFAPEGYDQAEGAGPSGWRASYVTAADNGLYGLYAFGTGPGQFDHNYARGHPDSGIYVGQCRACGAVVIDNVMEGNAVGYLATNASDVVVAGNVTRGNRVGMSITSSILERLAPGVGGSVVANLVVDNDDPGAPESQGGFGVGIVLAGGQGNEVRGNVVRGHDGVGILLVDLDDYQPDDNRIIGNELAGNTVDIGAGRDDSGPLAPSGSCLEGNGSASTFPVALAELWACDAERAPLPAGLLPLPDPPPGAGASEPGLPPAQPGRPGDVETWSSPAPAPASVDLDAVTVPSG